MQLPVPKNKLVLHFWRHGPTNSEQEAGSDKERAHKPGAFDFARSMGELGKARFPMPAQQHLVSNRKRSKELSDALTPSGHSPMVTEISELSLPEGELGEQMLEATKPFQSQDITIGRLLADEKAGPIFRRYGLELADKVLEATAHLPYGTDESIHVVIAGHMPNQNAIVWALIERRVSLLDELMVLNTAMRNFDCFDVMLTPVNGGIDVTVEVDYVPFPKE